MLRRPRRTLLLVTGAAALAPVLDVAAAYGSTTVTLSAERTIATPRQLALAFATPGRPREAKAAAKSRPSDRPPAAATRGDRPQKALRTVSAVSGPGVTFTSAETPDDRFERHCRMLAQARPDRPTPWRLWLSIGTV